MSGEGLFRAGQKAGRLSWCWNNPEENGWLAALMTLSNGRIGVRPRFPGSDTVGEPGVLVAGLFGPGRDYEREILSPVDPLDWQADTMAEHLDLVLDTGRGWAGLSGRIGGARIAMRWAVPQADSSNIVYREIQIEGPLRLSFGARWLDPAGSVAWRDDAQMLSLQAKGSGMAVATASVILQLDGIEAQRTGDSFTVNLAQGQAAHLLQVSAISLDERHDAAESAALRHVRQATRDAEMRIVAHQSRWAAYWKEDAPRIDPPGPLARGLTLGAFHLAQMPDRSSDVLSYGPRALTHRRYCGLSYFNTDLYLVPYFASQEPDIAAKLLRGRLEGLAAALEFGKMTGWPGARYPLVAALDGRPVAAMNPARQRIADTSHHMTANLLWAVRTYYRATGNDPLADADMARLCKAAVPYLRDVMERAKTTPMTGYDEFHPGVCGQWATQAMSTWALAWIAEITGEPSLPCEIPHREPFNGWGALPDKCVVYPDGERLPRLDSADLRLAQADRSLPNRLMKQADPLVPMVLWSEHYETSTVAEAYHRYEPRTAHASSLSLPIHAMAAARIGNTREAWRLLRAALRYNLDFAPRKSYANGIHLAGYAGAWWAILRGVLQIDLVGRVSAPDLPVFPEDVNVIAGAVWAQGRKLKFEARATGVAFEMDKQ